MAGPTTNADSANIAANTARPITGAPWPARVPPSPPAAPARRRWTGWRAGHSSGRLIAGVDAARPCRWVSRLQPQGLAQRRGQLIEFGLALGGTRAGGVEDAVPQV